MKKVRKKVPNRKFKKQNKLFSFMMNLLIMIYLILRVSFCKTLSISSGKCSLSITSFASFLCLLFTLSLINNVSFGIEQYQLENDYGFYVKKMEIRQFILI